MEITEFKSSYYNKVKFAKKRLAANTLFAISSFFAVRFHKADGKEPLCRQLADGKEVADGKMPDSSSVRELVII